MELCDVILRTNRVRCALNMEILDLLNEESVSRARSSRASSASEAKLTNRRENCFKFLKKVLKKV